MTKVTKKHNAPPSVASDLVAKLAELESHLSSLRAELDRSQKLAMLGTVAAMVAHEVNNLMTPITIYAQMAQASPGDAALVGKALDRARSGAEQASRIATSILALAKPDATVDRPECEVAAAVTAAIECVPRGTLRAIQLESRVQTGLRAAISQGSLQQIILNLVLNSVKALSRHAGTISILSRPDGPGLIVIEVEDDGPGMPADLASRVFEPFAACASGTGLGLAICDRLVREVGGSIWLDNPGGVGARFCIRLPRTTATKAV